MLPPVRTLAVLIFAVVVTAHVVQAVPTTNPSERSAVLQRERERYLQTIGSLPRLNVHRMSDVLHLKVENGQLCFESPVQPWRDFEARRLELDGLRFPASITYPQFVSNEPNSRQFELRSEDYPDDDLFGQLRLQWHPLPGAPSGELSIERTEQTSGSFFRVFYFQNPGMARLLVFANDASADHNLQSFNFLERDFVTLREKHADEVQDWLRPVLHRLQQDAIFVPDVNAAWQVLASQWPVSDKVTQTVSRLVPDLGSDQSRVRNRAANRLADLGRDGASAILRFDRTGLSLQQNVRLDEVVARFQRMPPADASRLAGNPDFLLDAEYCDDQIVRALATRNLDQILGRATLLNSGTTGPARLDAIEAIRLRLHPSPIALPSQGH